MDNIDSNINIGLNNTDCVIKTYDFQSVTYYNICNGKKHVVPYGQADLFFSGFAILVTTSILLMLGVMIYKTLKM